MDGRLNGMALDKSTVSDERGQQNEGGHSMGRYVEGERERENISDYRERATEV